MNRAKFLAVKTATKSRHHRWRLGAVAVSAFGDLIAKPNLPRLFAKERGICAETRLLQFLPKSSVKSIYVARVRADGTLGLAKPCEECMRIILAKGITKIHFTNDVGVWEQIRFH